jgi:Xaa-Pro aminopeptidase
MTIKERISALRLAMTENGISAWIITGTDPHMNEYLPAHWAEREFVSGFTGSAGKVVVTQDMAGLWTDGRYFIQAADQLQEGGLELFKEKIPGTPTITEFLCGHLNAGSRVGINGLTGSKTLIESFRVDFEANNMALLSELDLLAPLWEGRPPLSSAPLFTLPESLSGESTTSKLSRLREAMGEMDATLLTMLDEIAWLFNIRGADVDCNPVVMSYAWIEKGFAVLFVDENKISDEDRALLENSGINIFSYDAIFEVLPELSTDVHVACDFDKMNHALLAAMPDAELHNTTSWVSLAKAKKNTCELNGTRLAMLKDGVALTQFFMWLEETLTKPISEYEIGLKLTAFRAKQDAFVGESFAPIVGYESNGAITHYSAPIEGSKLVSDKGILLIDSGGQYKHGTTDITRTVALGELSEEMKTDFTLVLKGHINLACAKFPTGTRGSQLDALARLPLWKEGKDYQHGTGHGVGCFLNVHEGPQSIRKEDNKTALVEGMILSNEPGFYAEGRYGIRIENLVAVKAYSETFLEFETMTLFPIDKQLIKIDLLSPEEKMWLDTYHQEVYHQLSPLLSDEEKGWLRTKTLPILA